MQNPHSDKIIKMTIVVTLHTQAMWPLCSQEYFYLLFSMTESLHGIIIHCNLDAIKYDKDMAPQKLSGTGLQQNCCKVSDYQLGPALKKNPYIHTLA